MNNIINNSVKRLSDSVKKEISLINHARELAGITPIKIVNKECRVCKCLFESVGTRYCKDCSCKIRKGANNEA